MSLEFAVGEKAFNLIGVDGARHSGAVLGDQRGGAVDFMFFAKFHNTLQGLGVARGVVRIASTTGSTGIG